MELEVGVRLFWLILILGVLFLAEKATWIWKNIKLQISDYIQKDLETKSKVREGLRL